MGIVSRQRTPGQVRCAVRPVRIAAGKLTPRSRTRLRAAAVGAAAAALLVGCAPADGGSPTPSPAECLDPGPIVEIGSGALDADPTYVTVTAGTYVARAEGFEHGWVLDAPVGRTMVYVGPATNPPVYEEGPYAITNAADSFDVVEGSGTVVTLPAGRIWQLNTNGAEMSLQGCAGAQVSDVSTSP
jgi:hypothetical protein